MGFRVFIGTNRAQTIIYTQYIIIGTLFLLREENLLSIIFSLEKLIVIHTSEKEKSLNLNHSPGEKKLNDPSSKLPNKSAENVLEDSKFHNFRDISEINVARITFSPFSLERRASSTRNSSVPPVLSFPETPEKSVKSFDNGKQSLTIKSSLFQTFYLSVLSKSSILPNSFKFSKSPKSPIENEKHLFMVIKRSLKLNFNKRRNQKLKMQLLKNAMYESGNE